MSNIWLNDNWIYNTYIINEILPILTLGLNDYTKRIKNDKGDTMECNNDIIGKILYKIYYNEIFHSPKIERKMREYPKKPERVYRVKRQKMFLISPKMIIF